MIRDRFDGNAKLTRLNQRVKRVESRPTQERMSLDRGRFRVGEGEFLVDGQAGRFNLDGQMRVRDGGDLTIQAGGRAVVAGEVPIILRQIDVQGAPQAAISFGETANAIYGRDGVLVIQQGDNVLAIGEDGFRFLGVQDGDAVDMLGLDASGVMVRTSGGGSGGGGGDDPPPSGNPDGFIWPASPTKWGISSSWADHKNRTPPSAEPGTDVACPTGTNVYAPANGTITDVKSTNSAATGRYVTLRTTEGAWFRFLHLSRALVTVGQTVNQGDVIARSGGSGFGSDQGYGSHLHITYWSGPSTSMPAFSETEDFAAYMADN